MEYACDIIPRQIQIDGSQRARIPRPANAFMLYANSNRKKMARAFPLDSNKEISKRLGLSWKALDREQKGVYYEMAKKVDAEHKEKYPDYVYNPKEARIRKAMRDANRERAMGVAPATRAARRSQPWVLAEQDDQFMMASHGMRGVASPMCGNGFPTASGPPQQFMGPMHSYNKHIHLAPHEQPYLQSTNPMAQLQHQTEMWHYHDNTSPMRTPTADQFMLPTSQMYQHHQHQQQQAQQQAQEIERIDSLATEKLKTPMDTSAAYRLGDDSHHSHSSQSPRSTHSVHSNASNTNTSPAPEQTFVDERKDARSISRNSTERHLQQTQPHHHPQQQQQQPHQEQGFGTMDIFQEDVIIQNPFEKDDNVTIKKNTSLSPLLTTKPPQKSLPDFNAAFGSTERGRFQSPPVPCIQPKQGYLDFFLTNNDLKFEDFNI